jgi:hypothetical protein
MAKKVMLFWKMEYFMSNLLAEKSVVNADTTQELWCRQGGVLKSYEH